jgi:hypothetical protein
MKKRFRIGKLLFLSAACEGDVASIYRPMSKCRHCRDTLRDSDWMDVDVEELTGHAGHWASGHSAVQMARVAVT